MLPYLRGHKMLQPSGTIAVADYLPTKKSCHEPNDCQMRENKRYSRSTTIARWQQFEIDQESSQQPISEKKRDGRCGGHKRRCCTKSNTVYGVGGSLQGLCQCAPIFGGAMLFTTSSKLFKARQRQQEVPCRSFAATGFTLSSMTLAVLTCPMDRQHFRS